MRKKIEMIGLILMATVLMWFGFSSCDFYFGKYSETKESKYSLNDTNPVIKEYPIPRPITKQDLINSYKAGYFNGGLRQKMGNNLNVSWLEDSSYFVRRFR